MRKLRATAVLTDTREVGVGGDDAERRLRKLWNNTLDRARGAGVEQDVYDVAE